MASLNGDQLFTIAQLRAAGTSEKAWVAIRGKVYDVTDFAARHPGGKAFLMMAVGRDATAAFESFHDLKAIKVLSKREIGTLVGSDMPEFPTQSPFQAELRKNVEDYFKMIGKTPRDAPWMLFPYFVTICTYFVAYMVMFSPTISRQFAFLPWLAALAHGWAGAMLGLYILHDASHASFTRSPLVWGIMLRFYELTTGQSSSQWIHQHVLGHHPFTNVVDLDPDIIHPNPGVFRVHESQPWWSHYLLQSYYWLPLYSQLVQSRRLTDWTSIFVDGRFKSITINPPPLGEYFWAGASLLSLLLFRVIIPYYVFNFGLLRIFLLFTVCECFWSFYLTLIFQVSHVNDEVLWSQPSEGDELHDWATHQIRSSMDYAHGNRWTSFFVGSLNYQSVHHLFPYVSQYYYPAIAPIVRETCAKYGVSYNLRGTLSEVVALHIKRLVNMGSAPEPQLAKGVFDGFVEPTKELLF